LRAKKKSAAGASMIVKSYAVRGARGAGIRGEVLRH